MSSQNLLEFWNNCLSKKVNMTSDVRQTMPKFQPLGFSYEKVRSCSKKWQYLESLTNYDERDPFTSFTNKDDWIGSYFKQERKSNYKPGLEPAMGVFDQHFNFAFTFNLFFITGAFV